MKQTNGQLCQELTTDPFSDPFSDPGLLQVEHHRIERGEVSQPLRELEKLPVALAGFVELGFRQQVIEQRAGGLGFGIKEFSLVFSHGTAAFGRCPK